MAIGFGARFLRTLHGNAPIVEPFNINSSYGTALFEGDFVRLVSTTGAMDASASYANIERAATGEIILGVIVGFEPLPSSPFLNYNPASTNRIANVCIDPDAVYAIQEDAGGGSVTAALVGAMANCAFVVASGNTYTGRSGTMLDSSQTTASAADLKIVGVNRVGNNVAALSGGAVLEVMILAPALKSTDSQS